MKECKKLKYFRSSVTFQTNAEFMARGRGRTKPATLLSGILVMIVLASGLVFGQGFSAAISGVVRDVTGQVVPGVSITVRHIESGLTRTAVTSETGGYNIQALPVDPYQLTPGLPGLKPQPTRGINLPL